MNRENRSPPERPQVEEYVRSWYTTYNEDGEFPNGYDDAEGDPVFVLGSMERDEAWIAVPTGEELELVDCR